MSHEEMQKEILEMVKSLSDMMLVEAEIKCNVQPGDQEGQTVVNIEYNGSELGYMIGNHGAHLSALQYIYSLLINKKYGSEGAERIFVNVDVSGYRQERLDKVASLAAHLANEAIETGRPVDLRPMSPAERRVVHVELQKFDEVTTESFGEGRDRHVRIIPKNPAKNSQPYVAPSAQEQQKADDMSMFEDDIVTDLLDSDD